MTGFLITFLALTAAHLALNLRAARQVIRSQRRVIEGRDKSVADLSGHLLEVSRKWTSEKQESARLRTALEAHVPTDAELERGVW